MLTTLRADWQGVRRMRDPMRLLCMATFAGGVITAPALGGVVYNLPLLLAFDVLRSVLRQLRGRKGTSSVHATISAQWWMRRRWRYRGSTGRAFETG